MNKNKDILFTLLGIAVLAALIFAVYQSKRPDPVEIDLSNLSEKSAEHKFIGEVLDDTEAFAANEDASLKNAEGEAEQAPLPIQGEPLPVAWESQPAPTADQVALSSSLQRSFAASASLRTDEFVNPSSDMNLQRVEDLRAIRESRHKE